jgi:hypothetical protein
LPNQILKALIDSQQTAQKSFLSAKFDKQLSKPALAPKTQT